MFFKDFVSVKRQKIKRGASQTYDTPSTLGFRCKGNNSISENVLFDRQNVFLWSDLTLLSTNISKKSTFA